MSNGEVCCILGVCCPAGSPAQASALDAMIQTSRPSFSQAHVVAARKRVLHLFNNFQDVAPTIDLPDDQGQDGGGIV